MLGRMGKDAGSLLGVEIASDSVRIVQLRRRKGRYERVAWWVEQFEPSAAADWWQTPDRVLGALHNAYRRCGSRQRRAAVALPATQVICKVCQWPKQQPAAEMETQLLADADQLFPFPLEDLVMDFQVLGASAGQVNAQDLLVAATRQSVLQPIETIFDEVGLELVAVEVDSIALRRLLPQPLASGAALLRLEPASATLHYWSQDVLPQRREVPLQRLDESLVDGLQLEELVVASTLPLEQGALKVLSERLNMPCRLLSPVNGLECHDSGMTLACALALGELL
ncbi:type IV pilus biogenesis protein PilM [Pseudomonas sp. NPDC089752]|uniref:type IV pilus biogenesis protein PilM n=1 Tax=Pseudomonas sp. NPDC089752 TaxID=3364472 RepID=UPI00381A4FEC